MEQQATTKNSWGGKRVGAGKKSEYKEPTANITFRVPQSQKEIIRKMVSEYLAKFKHPYVSKAKQRGDYYGC
jgi:hypothetical protein